MQSKASLYFTMSYFNQKGRAQEAAFPQAFAQISKARTWQSLQRNLNVALNSLTGPRGWLSIEYSRVWTVRIFPT
jgi:hypothetical protein